MRLWICKCGWRNPAHIAFCRGCKGFWQRNLVDHADGSPSPKNRAKPKLKAREAKP